MRWSLQRCILLLPFKSICQKGNLSKKLTLSLLPLRNPNAWHRRPPLSVVARGVVGSWHLIFAVISDNSQDRSLKDLVDTPRLLAATLHVLGVHLLGHGHALVGRNWCEALCLEHVDAGLFVAEIGLEADQYQRRIGAEV